MNDLSKLYRALITDYLERWADWRYFNLTRKLRHKKSSALYSYSKYHVTNTHSTAELTDRHDPTSEKLQALIIAYKQLQPMKGRLLVKHYMNSEHTAKQKIEFNGLSKTTYYRYLTHAHDWLIQRFFEGEMSIEKLLAKQVILQENRDGIDDIYQRS